jgi:ABC-type lipoprotein export system ATPase subunit
MVNMLQTKLKVGKNQINSEESSMGKGKKPLIQLKGLTKTYYNAAGEFPALKDVNIEFSGGEFIGVIGKSGSGKSTLLNMITGIDRPTEGGVFVDGVPVHELSENKLAAWRGRSMGIVFQFFQLLPTLSLLENVLLPMDFCNMYHPRERKERAVELLRMVDMQDHMYKLPSAVSGGQQQRVAIARAMANDPPIIVADEPTGNLDSKTADNMFALFEQLIAGGKTIMVVTHDSSLARRVTRTALIADGELVNEWLVKALPTLSHQQMLMATKKLKPLSFSPGQTIISQDEQQDRFFIVTEGYVEVALQRADGGDVIVNRMGPGQYVGEIEMMGSTKAIASIRAAETPVRVVALDRPTFVKLMAESETTYRTLQNTIEERIQENRSARGG